MYIYMYIYMVIVVKYKAVFSSNFIFMKAFHVMHQIAETVILKPRLLSMFFIIFLSK